MKQQNNTEFNRKAMECDNHRMRLVSSERILVNPKYDDGTESATNVKEHVSHFKCFGPCQQTRSITHSNK